MTETKIISATLVSRPFAGVEDAAFRKVDCQYDEYCAWLSADEAGGHICNRKVADRRNVSARIGNGPFRDFSICNHHADMIERRADEDTYQEADYQEAADMGIAIKTQKGNDD